MKRISHCLSAARRALPLAGLPALLTALLLTASACQKAEEVPATAQLLPPDKMVSVLIELHTLEARTEAALLPPDSSRALFRQEQKKVYWRHEVSDSTFTQSFRYYAVRGKELNTIYQSVIDSLATREKMAK
ncbi:DUF4296 domain-containing protein [Hymenobacter terrestris]|uniref:DUF4296 domain-containing protein n=1 Tax=Hymenobacter terrestris TaxID=2748310 RepID=A0ABX2Q080_9BACT|nr:DUF4296 domain-containing protein [Hymenobacter terrestris]NVO84350.1 DUF4296 domain-containing protein [Hymenobacter terrestris]